GVAVVGRLAPIGGGVEHRIEGDEHHRVEQREHRRVEAVGGVHVVLFAEKDRLLAERRGRGRRDLGNFLGLPLGELAHYSGSTGWPAAHSRSTRPARRTASRSQRLLPWCG